jgi:DnaA family protein
VFQLHPIDESETAAVLRREAARRGIALGAEVIGYLMTHFARDLGSLMALLDALDEFALARKRAVTVPLLRQMLAERVLPESAA